MTPETIATMKLKELHGAYAILKGKPTVNRNPEALRKTVLKLLAAQGASAPVAPLLPAPPPIVVEAPIAPAKKPRKAPVKAIRATQPSPSRAEYTPESIGIGKVMKHGMRVPPHAGKIAECKATAKGFRVHMVDGKRRDDLGLHATLGEAARATGQNANGATFWRVKPYPAHKARASASRPGPKARGGGA